MILDKDLNIPHRNGILFVLADCSGLLPGKHPMMHLMRKGGVNFSDPWRPEVKAVECVTDFSRFHIPENVIYHMNIRSDKRVAIEVYKETIPVLHWVFPSIGIANDPLYVQLVLGLDLGR